MSDFKMSQVDCDALGRVAREISEAASQMNQAAGSLDALAADLRKQWAGQASDVFAQLHEQHAETYSAVCRAWQELGEALETSTKHYRQGNDDVVTMIRQLP